jgi:cell division septum initiation protein DivIVA
MLVTRGSHVLYDEPFHVGVNIIHGSNGSGKSTLADFVFFGLGGDLKDWKESASRAELVYLQIVTPAGLLTLRREISTDGGRPMAIFFGSMDDALGSPSEGWQLLPYRRPDRGYSFSQVLFKAIGLPESISDGASNITMHQLLRLLYVDQLTPVQRIFRVENFDTWQTRQAVGDLLSGVGGYDLFDKQIALRETEKLYDATATAYRSLVAVATGYGENILSEHIESAIGKMIDERDRLLGSIEELVAASETQAEHDDLKKMRADAIRDYNNTRRSVVKLTEEIEVLEYEIADAEDFIRHLTQSLSDFSDAAVTFFALGHLAFEYCPSCFAPVQPKDSDHCQLCDTKRVDGADDSRTLAVRLDLQMQLRESESLQSERIVERSKKTSALRVARQALNRASSTIELAQSGTVTGRESAIAELSRKVGFIDSELEGLQKRLELAKRIQAASEAKEDLNMRVTRLKSEIEALLRAQGKRKMEAYTLISNEAKKLLDQDLEEHSDFGDVTNVSFEFSGDWVAINGEKNRAGSASGMVILKNSFAAAMLGASLIDQRFNLPRWMLFDNVEDKGMVEERSWNFQRLLVSLSQASATPHQIIFTTSKIAPELDRPDLVVGRRYERAVRSLN